MEQVLKYYRLYFKTLFAIAPKYASRKSYELFATPVNKKVRTQETEALTTAQEETLLLDGNNIVVYKWGNGPKTALLVHGWEGNGGSLAGFKDELITTGYTVYSFDGPAHGKSTGKRTNVINFSYTVARIIEQKKIKDLVITHSFGSATTMYALSQNLHISIQRMVLLTSPNRLKDVITEFTDLMQFSAKNYNRFIAYMEDYFNLNINDIEVAKVVDNVNVGEFLIVHDEFDKIIPIQYTKNVANALGSRATFITMQKVGHYRMLWNQTIVSHVADFVAGVKV
jgi:pimeloyl-ACP methyl ester carboxylesterase